MDKELLEAIELFKRADDDIKAFVVDLLKSASQPDDFRQKYSEKAE